MSEIWITKIFVLDIKFYFISFFLYSLFSIMNKEYVTQIYPHITIKL